MSEKTTAKWDFGRFARTLAYYGVIPFVGSISQVKKMFQKEKTISKKQREGVILVAGATGGVGKRVVKKLQERGYKVRAFVRDAKRAKDILGTNVELIEGDITIPETLNQIVFENVTAVICCTGTRVQPKEGDTPTREKYYQGIKFYMPEVVDIPEVVEYQGMQNLVTATCRYIQPSGTEKILFDFTKEPSQSLRETWGILDDVVMGGVSESNIRFIDKTALFSGTVSTANSGGFASVRTKNFEPPLNLAGYTGIDIRVKGDGKRYKFIVRNDTKWDSRSYCYSFDTVYNTWFTVRVPFTELIPVFRAKTVKEADPFDPSYLTSIQLMLSKFEYDGELNPKFKPGEFQLQVESIKAYGREKLPQFIQISSAGVTRPGRPNLNLEEEPPAVRMNDQLGSILTWKLKGEDVIRSSGLTYTIIRPCALTEEPGNQNLVFEQGDNIRGKVSREDIADLCLEALENPNAVNLTFEVKASENGADSRNWNQLFSSLQSDS
jgi:uncharacterized protein YbjT (DUF2867 family)